MPKLPTVLKVAFCAAWLGALRPFIAGAAGGAEAALVQQPVTPEANAFAAWARRLHLRSGDSRRMLHGLQSQLGLLPSGSRPPVGGVYLRTLWLPVLGMQTISLTVVSHNRLRLQLSGAICLDDTVAYVATASGLVFEFSPPTKSMLRRFRTSFRGADYIADTDHAIFSVSPPLVPGTVNVQLRRQ
eukprot:scaffold14069_cov126-Isochrysis_galbana.AAC.5